MRWGRSEIAFAEHAKSTAIASREWDPENVAGEIERVAHKSFGYTAFRLEAFYPLLFGS